MPLAASGTAPGGLAGPEAATVTAQLAEDFLRTVDASSPPAGDKAASDAAWKAAQEASDARYQLFFGQDATSQQHVRRAQQEAAPPPPGPN